MAIHNKKPVRLQKKFGAIAEPPLAAKTGKPAATLWNNLRSWRQQQLIFSYSGPGRPNAGTHICSDAGAEREAEKFFVILHAPRREDHATETHKSLGGAIWFHRINGSEEIEPYVKWTPPGEAQITLWESNGGFNDGGTADHSLLYGDGLPASQAYPLFQHDGDRFEYVPLADGGFQVGTIETRFVHIAALSVWSMPDRNDDYTDTQAIIQPKNLDAGKIIRGYTGTGTPSLGDLIHDMGDPETDDECTVEAGIRKCLFQWGHGWGVLCSDQNTYYNIQNNQNASYPIKPANPYNKAQVKVTPVIVYSSSGMAGEDEIKVKIIMANSTETSELTISADATETMAVMPSLLAGASSGAGSLKTIDVDVFLFQTKISNGEALIKIHTFSIWEGVDNS